MPEAALTKFKPDHVASPAGMPSLFQRLVCEPQGLSGALSGAETSPDLVYEVELARGRIGSMSKMDEIGRRSLLACPDCHGVMWEIQEGNLLRYRCHVGHAYTAELMSLALDENVQSALASGLRGGPPASSSLKCGADRAQRIIAIRSTAMTY
jgi:two-component system, chemotaxis family, protein-glutamate methylesterase/glutaminase